METPCCFMDLYKIHTVPCVRGRDLVGVQDVLGSCHIRTYVHKKTSIVMNFRAHTRNRANCPGKHTFCDSSQHHWEDGFTHTEEDDGPHGARNMHICAVGCESMLYQHFCASKSWFPTFYSATQTSWHATYCISSFDDDWETSCRAVCCISTFCKFSHSVNLEIHKKRTKSHTHSSHSQTSRLLTSSLSLGVPVPRPTQCLWGV